MLLSRALIFRVLALVVVAIAFAHASFAAEIIKDIRVQRNKKTKSDVIISASGLEIGQEITQSILDRAAQRIANQGVFDEVRVIKNKFQAGNEVIITIAVKEKISWFIVPYLSFSTEDLSVGTAIGETNLFGRLKKAAVLGDWGPDLRRVAVGYRDPSVLGSRFVLSIDGIARRDDMKEYNERKQIREVRIKAFGATILPGYRWSDHFTTYLGPYYRKINHRLLTQSSDDLRLIELTDGNDISMMMRLEFDDQNRSEGFVTGPRISVESQVSDNRYGSDFNYNRQKAFYHQGYFLFHESLNFQHGISLQLGNTLPFYREIMHGGNNLRGYLHRQFRGDTRYSIQNEIWFPLFRYSFLVTRGVVFWDSAVLYFKDDGFKKENWNNGVGTGLRFYVKGINVPVLGFDFAYGVEDDAVATYLNVGAKF